MVFQIGGTASLLLIVALVVDVTSFSIARVGSGSKIALHFSLSAERQSSVNVPLSWDEMVRQASSAMKEAQEKGQTRQIIRVLLPRDSSSGDLGRYFEATAGDDGGLREASLVPPDESWQGGIMQLYRAAAPTASAILREWTQKQADILPPRITEDRSVDESGVDGVGLLCAEDTSVTCWVQPTQENIDGMEASAEKAAKDQLVVLLNPQWRTVDDALDTYSQQGDGFLSGLASFLGGKGGTLKRLGGAGFQPVYTLEGYVCRGANVRLLKIVDSDWSVFCERDDGESFLDVGTSTVRPTYQQVDEMLQQADIGFKYARDMGLQPKL